MDGLESWSDFNAAMGAASAALAGLIVVALSVNIAQVLKYPGISTRAAASLAVLVLTLVASMVALIPGQPLQVDGSIILACGAIVAVIGVHAIRVLIRTRRLQSPSARGHPAVMPLNVVLYLLPLLAIMTGAVLLIFGISGGAYFVALGSIAAIVGAVVFSWVALVEILR